MIADHLQEIVLGSATIIVLIVYVYYITGARGRELLAGVAQIVGRPALVIFRDKPWCEDCGHALNYITDVEHYRCPRCERWYRLEEVEEP